VVTFSGLPESVLVAVGVTTLVELIGGARAWVPMASRAGALLAVYLVLVVLLLPLNSSVVLTTVEPIDGMPAAAAGVEKGDRVRAVNGVAVETFGELAAYISAGGPDVSLTIDHGGTRRELTVHRTAEGTVGIKPSGEPRSQTPAEIFSKPLAAFSASLHTIRDLLKPKKMTAVGGPVMLYTVGGKSSPVATLGIALGVGCAFTFPLVAAALLASLWFRPRLLQRTSR